MYELIIADCRRVLNAGVPDTAAGLTSALKGTLRLREQTLSARVEAQRVLATKRELARHPKDKEFTDLDRGVMLEAAVADYAADFELLSGLETLLGERLKVLNSLLLQTEQGSKSIS